METQPDAADARRALDEIAQVRTQASARKRTPMWLWHVLGLLSFAWVVSYALPRGWGGRAGRWGAAAVGVGQIGLALGIVILHSHGAGNWVLFVAGALVYLSFIIVGPLSEQHIGAPTRALS